MMKKWIWMGLVGLCYLSAWAEITVTNLVVAQREGTKVVDISYDVFCDATNTVTVTLSVALSVSNGTVTVNAPCAVSDVGEGVLIGMGLETGLDIGVDQTGGVSDLAISANELDDAYLVIDLSGGPSATNYPVSSLRSLPNPISEEYKTTQLVLHRIPAGTFMMGSPSAELGRHNNETQHQVMLSEDFYMGVFELTQKQWELVMGNTPSQCISDLYPVEKVSYDDIRGSSIGAGWPETKNVDITSFMGILRQRTGLMGLDLPTEAQWEYACRAGTTRAYNDQAKNNGEGSDCRTKGSGKDVNLDSLAVYRANDPGHEANVGTKQANAWGLYDMHGNVYEWCLDWYTRRCGSGTVTNPVGVVSGSNRVSRGGGWYYSARSCRSAYRTGSNPDYRYINIGLRICLVP